MSKIAKNQVVSIDYTLTDEAEYIKPKPRVY